MTDYFAVLHQPRRPWLDPDELKQKYQELTLANHPDRTRSTGPGPDFAAITEGYRVLSDDRLRIQHLLKIEGQTIESGQTVPGEFIDLFTEIGDFVRTTDDLLERSAKTQNALGKSLLRAEILGGQKRGEEILSKLTRLHDEALHELRSLNDLWTNDQGRALAKLSELHQRLAYLTRWIEQVRERQFRLAS